MTDTSGARPIDLLRGVVHSACWAVDLTKENRPDEASEHIDAIERLIAAYRADGDESKRDIHTHFGLSYANYLVLPRTLLQSMPKEWQHQFVALLEQMNTAFEDVPQAEAYIVQAATEKEAYGLTVTERQAARVAADGDEDDTTYTHTSLVGEMTQLGPDDLVLVPTVDPVPDYNRGRTRVEPRLDGAE